MTMTPYEMFDLGLSLLALVVAGVAHVRITSYKKINKVGNLSQKGSRNQQAGKDITNY